MSICTRTDLAAAVRDDEHRERVAQLVALMPYATRPYSDEKTYISEKYLEAVGENMHLVEDFVGARQKHAKNLEYCALRKLRPRYFRHVGPEGSA